ncbi:hypothetical protein RFI_32257, partial [Reticulomyxa filosa]
NELHVIEGNKEDDGIFCLKFIELKKKEKTKDVTYALNLCVLYYYFEKFAFNVFLKNKFNQMMLNIHHFIVNNNNNNIEIDIIKWNILSYIFCYDDNIFYH